MGSEIDRGAGAFRFAAALDRHEAEQKKQQDEQKKQQAALQGEGRHLIIDQLFPAIARVINEANMADSRISLSYPKPHILQLDYAARRVRIEYDEKKHSISALQKTADSEQPTSWQLSFVDSGSADELQYTHRLYVSFDGGGDAPITPLNHNSELLHRFLASCFGIEPFPRDQ